jgi:Tfp pilus assembly PilM family ATPase
MARLLAFEWGLAEARVAVARTRGDGIVVEHAFAVDLGPRDPGETFSDKTVGDQLAKALAKRGLGRIDALVAVGRASIELRQLSLPPAPIEELPDLVRFQALQQFTTIGEDWAIDFVQLGTSDDESLEVLTAAISPEMISQISSICQTTTTSAPKRLVLRPFAAASLLRHHDRGTPQPCRLMVDLLADEADLTILVDESVVLMRTVRLAIADDGSVLSKALLGEIRRTIASAQNQLKGRRVEKVILCGDGTDQQTLKEEIESGLALDVEMFDPFDGLSVDSALSKNRPQHAGRFAPLLGMLLDEAGASSHPIDFLHPRERPKPPSNNKRNSFSGVAAIAALALLAFGIYFNLSSLDSELKMLQAESDALKPDVEEATTSIAHAASVQKFLDNDITWLDELYNMAEQLPPAEDAIFTQLNVSTRQPAGGQIVLDGYTREAEQLSQLRDALRVGERSIVSTGTSDDARRKDYHWRFKETVLLKQTISLDKPEPSVKSEALAPNSSPEEPAEADRSEANKTTLTAAEKEGASR